MTSHESPYKTFIFTVPGRLSPEQRQTIIRIFTKPIRPLEGLSEDEIEEARRNPKKELGF